MEPDFPSNKKTNRTTEPAKPPVQKVLVSGDVVRRKKPLGRRFVETFGGGDARGVMGFVFLDILLPGAKDMFADAVSQGVEKMIFGEPRSASRRSPRGSAHNNYVSYNRYSSPADRAVGRAADPRGRSRVNTRLAFDEVILPQRVEAEEVMAALEGLINEFGQATMSDLYGMIGVTAEYTHGKWGWTDLRLAGITRVREGYLLDLPRPEPVD